MQSPRGRCGYQRRGFHGHPFHNTRGHRLSVCENIPGIPNASTRRRAYSANRPTGARGRGHVHMPSLLEYGCFPEGRGDPL
eukprot:471871-Prorocentrum_minimum.AAC.1